MALNEEQEEKLRLALEELLSERKALNDWERSFLDDNIARFDKHGQNTNMSPKQWAILDKMLDKVRI